MAAVSSLNDRADGSRVRNVLGSGLCWRDKQRARKRLLARSQLASDVMGAYSTHSRENRFVGRKSKRQSRSSASCFPGIKSNLSLQILMR